MKKLFLLIFLGSLVFIGGQWIGLEMQPHPSEVGNASVPNFQPSEPALKIDPLKTAPLPPVK